MITQLYTMEKYNQNHLSNFKKLWTDAHFNNISNELANEEIFADIHEDIKWLFSHMKRICDDYLYKANVIRENLINSKHQNHDILFQPYSKVLREYFIEN
jgi:phenylalanyl-tRNA synthetase alpha subunit